MKPTYRPFCGYDCRDCSGNPRLASEWVHVDGVTLFACDQCAQHAFNLPSPATVRRRREAMLRKVQEVLDV